MGACSFGGQFDAIRDVTGKGTLDECSDMFHQWVELINMADRMHQLARPLHGKAW
jgi:hypothetical protein